MSPSTVLLALKSIFCGFWTKSTNFMHVLVVKLVGLNPQFVDKFDRIWSHKVSAFSEKKKNHLLIFPRSDFIFTFVHHSHRVVTLLRCFHIHSSGNWRNFWKVSRLLSIREVRISLLIWPTNEFPSILRSKKVIVRSENVIFHDFWEFCIFSGGLGLQAYRKWGQKMGWKTSPDVENVPKWWEFDALSENGH